MEENPVWTLEELSRRAAQALTASPRPDPVGGRAREVPDQRAIRWYTSIGLVDRPVGGRGRGARYGVRHLRQIVAIKRLQAQGCSLADIQGRLAGADDDTLRALAALPQQTPEGSRADALFWKPGALPVVVEPHAPPAASPRAAPPAPRPAQPMGAVRLAEGVVLVLPRQPSRDHLALLAEAAAPLVATLAALGLVLDPSSSADPVPGASR